MGQIGFFFNTIFTYPIFNALILLYHLFGDFGLSIIVLTIIIRLILFPLTVQQLKSQKATQAIQPQMAEVRKKYAKDQRAQYQAMQELQKEYGVNPLAGCLPLVIQLPVLYGLFYALNGVLKNATIASINANIYPFLSFARFSTSQNITTITSLNWFTFLNSAWHISLSVSDPTHILPVLAGIATFIQLRMSQPKNTTGSKDAMTQQMQMMQFVMPFITFFFALNFAAGLALYWTTSSIFGIVQQYFITGWGALLVVPNIKVPGSSSSSNNKSSVSAKKSTSDQRKETRLLQKADEPEAQVVNGNGNGPVGRNLKSAPSTYGNDSTARRRPRNNSASARRRGNAPKRNASRS